MFVVSFALSETNDVNTGLLIEVWSKGMLWDNALGYHWIPLPVVKYSNEVKYTCSIFIFSLQCFHIVKQPQKLAVSSYLTSRNITISSIERVEGFKYLGTTLTNQNSIQAEINSRLKLGNACYYSVQNLLSSRLLSKNLKIKIYRTKILPVVLYGSLGR
jgi:hypothetical protein